MRLNSLDFPRYMTVCLTASMTHYRASWPIITSTLLEGSPKRLDSANQVVRHGLTLRTIQRNKGLTLSYFTIGFMPFVLLKIISFA